MDRYFNALTCNQVSNSGYLFLCLLLLFGEMMVVVVSWKAVPLLFAADCLARFASLSFFILPRSESLGGEVTRFCNTCGVILSRRLFLLVAFLHRVGLLFLVRLLSVVVGGAHVALCSSFRLLFCPADRQS